jgi:hypothetical protein
MELALWTLPGAAILYPLIRLASGFFLRDRDGRCAGIRDGRAARSHCERAEKSEDRESSAPI